VLGRHACQPTQDLTIDAETGPTQFRVSMEARAMPWWCSGPIKLVSAWRSIACANVVSDAGAQGTAAFWWTVTRPRNGHCHLDDR
jgi:multidrug efflux pump